MSVEVVVVLGGGESPFESGLYRTRKTYGCSRRENNDIPLENK